MKRLIILSVVMLIINGCTVKVRTVYDHQTDFKKYKNFCWLGNCEFIFKGPDFMKDSLIKEKIQRAIKSEMKKKGINFNSESPDLLMDVQVVLKTDTAYIYHQPDDEYSLLPFASPEKVLMLKGTLVIAMVDQKAGKMVWRSVAVSYFDLHPDLSEENFSKGVASALKEFPPKSSK